MLSLVIQLRSSWSVARCLKLLVLCIAMVLGSEGASAKCEKILLRDGTLHFFEIMRRISVSPRSSAVHSFEDVSTQVRLLALTTPGEYGVNQKKEFFTWAAHFLDDYFDNPNIGLRYPLLEEHRNDVDGLLDALGKVGEVGREMIRVAGNPVAAYAVRISIQRMAYGGLIQRAPTAEKQGEYLREYQAISMDGLSPDLRELLSSIDPTVFWLTTKTVLDEMFALESDYNRDLTELWNLALAPLIYFHDHVTEEEAEEMRFLDQSPPTPAQMASMLRPVFAALLEREAGNTLGRVRLLQVTFRHFRAELKTHAPELIEIYEENLERLQGSMSHRRREAYLDPLRVYDF